MIYKDMYLFIIEIVITIILYFLAGYAVKAISSKWKLLYLLPAIICMFFVAFSGVEISLAGIYIGVVVMLIGFFREDKGIRHAISIISILCMLLSVAVCILNPYYRAVTYVDDFKEAFDELKTHYVLSDYKDIDWDMLYEKYLPEFETAYREQNAAKNTVAWMKFTREFDDVHVSYMAEEKETNDAAYDLMYGNDYGLSLMKLSDGDVVAVNVEKDSVVYNAGIRNGTIITLWDKKTIDEVAADIDIGVMSFACKENEDFYSALLVAGIGDDDVEISFIDDSGRTCTVTALKLGTYTRRLKSTLSIIDKGAEISNLCWNDIDEHTLLLRLRQMEYDAETSQSGEFEIMKEEIKQAVDERRERGVTNLILDLRSNVGGSGDYVKAIAELFAPEGEHVYAYDGVFNKKTFEYEIDPSTGRYKIGECMTYNGCDLWHDGRIILLVNAETVSAGDHLTKLMSEYPNVTVMGFTHTSCSAQGINGVTFDHGMLSYSAVLLLNEDGTIFIDTDKERESTVPLDIKVPFDENAVKSLFDDNSDYLLECAMEEFRHPTAK